MSSLSALSASRQVPSPASNDSILCGRLTVQPGESGGIVKVTPERVLLRRKLAEHIQPQLTRPPVVAPGAAAGCVANGRAFAERVGERDKGRLVPSRDQEVSLVGAGKGTTLGGNERQEPEQHAPDGGCHGKKNRPSVDGTTGRVWLQSEPMPMGRENVMFRGQRATFISNFCTY